MEGEGEVEGLIWGRFITSRRRGALTAPPDPPLENPSQKRRFFLVFLIGGDRGDVSS